MPGLPLATRLLEDTGAGHWVLKGKVSASGILYPARLPTQFPI